MSQPPEPTPQDHHNAALRQQIADRQAQAFGEALALALGALGPGWQPWMRLDLIDADHRENGNREPIATVFKVYRGEERLTERSVFLRKMPDGLIQVADSYEPLFGDLLHEKHATKGFMFKGDWVAYPKWTLCWSAMELYSPKDAGQLAALRATRERKREERAERKWTEENPLLAQAGIRHEDVERKDGARGR